MADQSPSAFLGNAVSLGSRTSLHAKNGKTPITRTQTPCQARPTRKQICRRRHNHILHLIMSMQGNISGLLEDLGTFQQEGRTTNRVLENVQESARNDGHNQVFGESSVRSEGA